MNTSHYAIFAKKGKSFKFIVYCGDFIDFVDGFKHKIYFKVKIPSFLFLHKRLSLSWYKRFCEDFYFLNLSGISILDSMEIFESNSKASGNKKMYRFFKTIGENLLKGNSLYDSIECTNYKFDNMFLSLIKISEETGSLTEILKNLSIYYEEKILINNKIKSSLLYPSLLFCVMLLLINLCILYFIPSYVDSFHTQFSNLPGYSLIFINICLFIKDKYLLFLLMTILMPIVLITSSALRKLLKKFIFGFSVFRKMYFKHCQLKFIQSLYYMVNGGIDISNSLKIMATMKGESYSVYSNYIHIQINQGFDFCDALRNTKIFEPEVVSIIKVGEKSSNLNLSLKNIWTSYSKKYYQNLDKYTKLIEPVFIIICGFMVIIFISIFILPLISYDNFSYIWEGF